MKNLATTLAMLLFASTMVPAQDLDRNSFNLSKVNKGDFLLCEKAPVTIPPPPKDEKPKIEEPQKNSEPKLKIEPRPLPKGKVEETTQPQNPIYTDGAGNIRRRTEDGQGDWYWSPNNGGYWWRPANGPVQPGISRSIIQAPAAPYCPPGR